MVSDPLAILALLVVWGAFLLWAVSQPAERFLARLRDGAGAALVCAEAATTFVAWTMVQAVVRSWRLAHRVGGRAIWAGRALAGEAWCRPERRDAMSEERTLAAVRRDVTAAAELTAVAAAALRAIQEKGGTATERAGVARVTAMARACAESAIETIDFAEGRLPAYLRQAD